MSTEEKESQTPRGKERKLAAISPSRFLSPEDSSNVKTEASSPSGTESTRRRRSSSSWRRALSPSKRSLSPPVKLDLASSVPLHLSLHNIRRPRLASNSVSSMLPDFVGGSGSNDDGTKKESSTSLNDANDCGKPINAMAKSIVTMLTAASMYAGMELDENAHETPETAGVVDKEKDSHNDNEEDKQVEQDVEEDEDDEGEEEEEEEERNNSETMDTLEKQALFANATKYSVESDKEPEGNEKIDNYDETHASSVDKEDSKIKDMVENDIKNTKHNVDHQTSYSRPDLEKAAELKKGSPGKIVRLRNLRKRSTFFELSVVNKFSSGESGSKDSRDIAIALSEKLKKTFNIGPNDEFIGDYSCWLLKDVLLQGHLYITNCHILFFAYLPKKQGAIAMSGSLGVKSYTSRRISRKWAILRDNTLSIYSNSTDLYFPIMTIDLRYALRAEVIHKHHVKSSKYVSDSTAETPSNLLSKHEYSSASEPTWFRILTESRGYDFQADSLDSVRSWVGILKKHIFAARNKGDHVTIKIPLQNILDLELTPVFDSSETLRIKILESLESYAVDDYYFMFLNSGDKAVEAINGVMKQAGLNTDSILKKAEEKQRKEEEEKKAGKSDSVKNSSFSKKSNSDTNINAGKLRKLRSVLSPRLKSSVPDDSESSTSTTGEGFNAENSEISSFNLNKNASGEGVVEKIYKYNNNATEIPEIVISNKGKVKSTSISNESSSTSSALTSPDLQSTEDEQCEQLDDTPVSQVIGEQPVKSISDIQFKDSQGELQHLYSRWTPRYFVRGLVNTTNSGITHVNNLSTMWAAEPHHYDEANSLERGSEDPYLIEDPKERLEATQRFHKHFSLSDQEKLISSYYAHLIKNIPLYGKLYIGTSEICYRSLLPGTKTLMILPFKDIENVYKEKGFRFGYSGLVIVIHGHEELFFEFGTSEARDDCETLLLKQIDLNNRKKSQVDTLAQNVDDIKLAESTNNLAEARIRLFENKISSTIGVDIPIIVENNPFSETCVKPHKPYRFTLLTIGSRGDVQPYIALGKGLLKEGHKVKIVSHAEFRPWVEKYGMEFGEIAGDPAELMNLMVTHGSMSVAFLKEASSKFRGWITDLLESSWVACQDADILVESPSAMAGIHIAEALGIPYFRAFTMPWTKTRAYPHAFIVPDQKRGGSYNYLTHVMFENVFWKGISGQVNKWRKETLKLPKTSLDHLQQSKVPFLYNISPTVFPPSVDFADWVKVTGYWFLDEGLTYEPPKELLEFMDKARKDGKKLVYIGFGSIVVSDPRDLTEAVVNAVIEADVRCILNKGWSNRLDSGAKNIEIELPPEVYNAGSIPHDWLFPKIDAAVHHGGSGTTGATLRAGLPTIIKPFFGDQFFYANRVEDIGAGIGLKKLNSKSLSKAIKEVVTNQRIIKKAEVIGKQIRSEDGVNVAISTIYKELEYSRKLILNKIQEFDHNSEGIEQSIEDEKNEDSWLMI